MTTLNQTGLSMRWGKSAQWIRRQGEYVTWNGETWARMEYSSKRCAGYLQVVRRSNDDGTETQSQPETKSSSIEPDEGASVLGLPKGEE